MILIFKGQRCTTNCIVLVHKFAKNCFTKMVNYFVINICLTLNSDCKLVKREFMRN